MTSIDPVVTVVMPCYNYGRYLSEALESLLMQTYANWECIIIDDASTDNSQEVALLYAKKDQRFKYYLRPKQGVSSARNYAIQQAKGAYIQFLDADDLIEAEKLRLQVDLLDANAGIDLVYSSMVGFRDIENDERKYWDLTVHNKERVSGSGEYLIAHLLDDSFFLPGCVFCRKDLVSDLNGFDERIRGFEDWHLWYRLALSGKSFYFDTREHTRLLVRDHANNTAKNKRMMLQHRVKARKNIMDLIRTHIKKGNLALSSNFLKRTFHQHLKLLIKDKVRLNFQYESFPKGCFYAIMHFLLTFKIKVLRDGIYLARQRIFSHR